MTQSGKFWRSGTLLLAFMLAIAGIAFVEPRTGAAAAPGDPLSLTITLPGAETWGIHLYGTVCVKVDWGDGTSSEEITSAGTPTRSYAAAGTYSVTVSPGTGCAPSTYLTQFGATNPSATHKDYNSRIVSVESFGDLGIRSLNDAFRGATSLTTVPSTLPSSVISLEGTFLGATAFDDDISGWLPEGNGVKYLHEMFELATSFNQDITSWDVSRVLTMDEMFDGAGSAMAFNQDLSSWDFSGLNRNWLTEFNNDFGRSETDNGNDPLVQFIQNAGLDRNNYSELLQRWSDQAASLPDNLSPGTVLATYACTARDARANLVAKGWTFNDGGLYLDAPTITSITPGASSLEVAFTLPGCSADLDNFEYTVNNGGTWTAFSPEQTSSPLTVPGVTAGTTYQVGIRGKTSVAGASSTIFSFRNVDTSISTASLPPFTANEAYSTAIQATGAVNPLAFSVSSGSLPPGMTLSSAGILSGTPTTAGNYSFTVTVADAQGTPLTDSQSYSVSVSPRLLGSSEGRDFFVTFDANLVGYEDTVRSDTSVDIPQFPEQWLYLSGEPNTVVTVHYPPLDPDTGLGATTTDVTIPSSGVATVDASNKLVVKTVASGELATITSSFVNGLPTVSARTDLDLAGASASDSEAFNALRMQVKTEGKKVAVYGAHLQRNTSDAFSAIPTQSLGTRYRAVAWDHFEFGVERPSRISIIATQPGTTEVTITPPSGHDGLHNAGGGSRTSSYSVSLSRGEVYSVTGTTTADITTFGDDVTGTLIVSDKSVVVSSGNECAKVGDFGSCDHLVQYMPPVTAWGDSYILASSINSNLKDRYRVVADTDGTTLSLNGSPVLSGGIPVEIDAGEYYQFEASAARAFDVLETNHPVLVAKFIAGGHSNRYFWNYTGDPSLTVVTPTLQFLDSYKVSTPSSGFSVHSINVVMPTAEVGSLTITDLDSSRGLVRNLTSPGTNGQTGAIAGTDYSFVRFDVPAGAYEISADEGIGVYVEGFKNYDSYSYVGGMAFVNLVENPEGALAVQRELEPTPSPSPPPAPSSGGGGSPAASPAVQTPTPNVTPEPAVTPRVIPRLPATPPTQQGPVLRGNVPPAPPSAPTATIGGRSTPIQTQVTSPTGFSLTAGVLNLGLQVQQDQGVVRQNNTGGTEVEVKTGSTTALTGSGLLPRSTVQVFLPLQGTNSKEVARIPVDETGAFSGDAVFATRANERPMPIGRQVMQIVSLDENGQQSVVEMTINIAQGAPAPELDRTVGQVPTLTPGQSIATNAGEPEVVQVSADSTIKSATVEGDGWTMSVNIGGARGEVSESSEGGALLQFVRGEGITITGGGFMPGTRADVWLFSDPTLLGTVDIDENGELEGNLMIDGSAVPVGDHTLQMQGVGADGYVRSANLGVTVSDAVEEVTTEEAAGGLLWWLVGLIAVIGLAAALTIWQIRSRRA